MPNTLGGNTYTIFYGDNIIPYPVLKHILEKYNMRT
jgi:hypothetical protein